MAYAPAIHTHRMGASPASSSSLMEQRLAESCNLLVVVNASMDAARADDVVSLVEKVAAFDLEPTAAAQVPSSLDGPLVMHQATLQGAPPGQKSLYVVLSVATVEAALRVKARLDVLRNIAGFEMLDVIAWVDRSTVEEHCAACARTSVVALDLHPTRLEAQLCAKRCPARKRKLEDPSSSRAVDGGIDALPCLVLYLSNSTPTQQGTEDTQRLLSQLERIAAERSLPITNHFLDGVKRRFFLQAATEADASRIRELFITLAKQDGSLLAQFQSSNAISAATLKLCSLKDMVVAMGASAS